MPGQTIRIQPDEFTKEQHHRVGIVVPDRSGNLWTYCLFPGANNAAATFNTGALLVDSASADLIGNAGVGTLTSDTAAGTEFLEDTGEFAGKDLRGAIGTIASNDGVGQAFQVIRVVNNDTLEIALLWDSNGNPSNGNQGWTTALTTASTYEIMFPGRVKIASATDPFLAFNRAVMQQTLTVPAKEVRYGWALQRGLGIIAHDTSSPSITHSSFIGAGDDTPGQVEGAGLIAGTAPSTVATVLAATRLAVNAVGRGIFSIDHTTVPAYIDIRNNLLSYRFPIKDEPYSKDDQGNLVL